MVNDTNQLINDSNVADTFNQYFVSISPSLKNNLSPGDASFIEYLAPPLTSSIYFSPSIPLEVSSVISSLKSTKNSIRKIWTKTLKFNNSYITIPISKIFNSIVQTGIYPKKFKRAQVIPIFKSGNHKDVSNYRPISTLNYVNIVIEKLLFSRINSFLNKNNIIVDTQYGFWKGYTTSDTVLRLLHNANLSLNN